MDWLRAEKARTSIMAYSPSAFSWQNGQVMTVATRLLSDLVDSIVGIAVLLQDAGLIRRGTAALFRSVPGSRG